MVTALVAVKTQHVIDGHLLLQFMTPRLQELDVEHLALVSQNLVWQVLLEVLVNCPDDDLPLFITDSHELEG